MSLKFRIIIEGPDRTGKSTLSKAISSSYEKVLSIHASQPVLPPIEEYTRPFIYTSDRVVLDRWHWGQIVYPILYPQGRIPLQRHEFLWIEMYLNAKGFVVWYTSDNPDNVQQRILQEEDSYLQAEDALRCHNLFELVSKRSILPVTKINISTLDDTHFEAKVQGANYRFMQCRLGRLYPNIIGDVITPRFLFVKASDQRLPFVPIPKTPNDVLLRSVSRMPEPARIAMAHINNHDTVDKIWAQLGSPRVVAFGQEASQILTSYTIPHGVVEAPKSKGSKYEYEYSLSILDAANGVGF